MRDLARIRSVTSNHDRSSTFKTMICQADLFNALLAVDEVIGPDSKVFIATDALGNDEVAVTILPAQFQLAFTVQFTPRITQIKRIRTGAGFVSIREIRGKQ